MRVQDVKAGVAVSLNVTEEILILLTRCHECVGDLVVEFHFRTEEPGEVQLQVDQTDSSFSVVDQSSSRDCDF